jgi:hypothetical protein
MKDSSFSTQGTMSLSFAASAYDLSQRYPTSFFFFFLGQMPQSLSKNFPYPL